MVAPQRILLAGAGYVGVELGTRLTARGHRVYALRRTPQSWPVGVNGIVGDVTAERGLVDVPRSIDQLVYMVSPAERSELAYRAAYVEGLARVRTLLPEARVLLLSSTAVYGEANGQPLDESSALGELTGTRRQLALAERSLTRPDAVVLRASGIYGPGRTSLLGRLGRGDISAEERTSITNRIHRDDLARCLLFFIERPEVGGIYNATDNEPCSLGVISDWLRAQRLPAVFLVPTPAPARRLGKTAGRALSNAKLRGLGFDFTYPSFREGYGALLADASAP